MKRKAKVEGNAAATAAPAADSATAKFRSRFDPGALRALAGDTVFARGEAYHRGGKVTILAIEPARVVARVAGTEDYRTILEGRGRTIDGECSCRAFQDTGFCKHMVATALAANAAGAGGETGGGALARIRDYLKGRSVEALAEMILDLAERDSALFGKLELAAAAVHADAATLETRVRGVIDNVTRTRDYVEYRAASGWAADVDSVLDTLAELASGAHADVVLKLAMHAVARIERAVESIDDSDGHCGALLHQARDIHLEACRAAKPDPVALADELFEREIEDDYDVFYRAAALYADVLGDEGLAEYRRLAMAAWEKLPPRAGGGPARYGEPGDYFRLSGMLDFFAERDGDVEARVALRAKDLSSPWNYLEIAKFCLSQGREDEALRYAEEGLWVFEDERPDERLVFCAAELLLKAGRKGDAEAHLWRAFAKAPSLELYQRLRKLGGTPARDRALAELETRVAKGQRISWSLPAGLLTEILMKEKMFDAAWKVAREHEISRAVKDSLARASEKTHPREALALYAGRVEEFVQTGGNHGYEEACKLIGRMGALRDAGEQAAQAAYVADLKLRFRLKRNFIKLLG